jgi:hypothetical protein
MSYNVTAYLILEVVKNYRNATPSIEMNSLYTYKKKAFNVVRKMYHKAALVITNPAAHVISLKLIK